VVLEEGLQEKQQEIQKTRGHICSKNKVIHLKKKEPVDKNSRTKCKKQMVYPSKWQDDREDP